MNYLSQVIRNQKTRKSLSIINITGLSVCLAAGLLILLYVKFESGFDSFHDGDRVYRVESRLYDGDILSDNWATTTYGHAPAMSKEIPGIEKFVRVTAQDREQVVTYQDTKFTETRYCYTEPAFFEIFNFPIIFGDKRGQLVRPNTVVMSEKAAKRYFGEADPIGKTLTFHTSFSQQNFEVTGVMEDMPVNSHIHFDFLLSYSTIPPEGQEVWFIHGVYTYVRLQPGKDPRDIETAFSDISGKYKTDALKHKEWAVELVPLKDIHLTPQKGYEKEIKGSETAVYILSVMALALLLIGWVNSLNLNTARVLERGKEFGVRKAFGASRLQLLTQGLLDAGIIHLVAIVIAFGLLEVLLPVIYSWTGQNFGKSILLLSSFWFIVVLIFITGTFFTGLYPSFLMLRIRPSDIMRSKFLHGKKGNSTRKALIVIQFIASFILITGTIVVVRQVRYMQQEMSPVTQNRILVLKYPSFTEDLSAKTESFKKQLKQLSFIRQVAVSGSIPGVEVANYFANRPLGSDPSEIKLMQMFAVDYDYLAVYSPDMVSGRGFSETYGDEINKVVLNEEAVRILGFSSNDDAIGKKLTMEVLEDPLEVVGVVRNYYQQSLAVQYKPIVFFIKERVAFISTPYISVQMESKVNTHYITEVEQIYKDFFPTSLFSYFLLDEFINNQYKEDRNLGWIFAAAALLALFVACLGLWVVTLFSTLSRIKEIGIRKVLGADKLTLFILLTREIFVLMAFASVVGIPFSWFLMSSWLNSYAFHITVPWWVYPVSFLILMFIAFLTIIRQIWRAIRSEPMRILRSE